MSLDFGYRMALLCSTAPQIAVLYLSLALLEQGNIREVA